MTNTSNPTKPHRSTTGPKPSAQDPVQRWLDIFIPMTGLSKARQADIRAELEDHLRARVDDLMITGLSEPDAVQTAVNELGETAHLARQFRTALKPKRNTLMHAAIIAVAGSALTLGILNTTNNAQPPVQRAAQQAIATANTAANTDALSNAVPSTDYAFAKGGTIDLRTATLTTLFDQVRANLDRPLVIHWEHLDQIGIPKDQPIGLDADPVPTEVALRLTIQQTESGSLGGIAIVNNPEAVEITTTDYLDRRTKQIRPHNIADLIAHYEVPTRSQSPFANAPLERNRQTAEQAGNEILQTIMPLASQDAWTDFGGELATGSVVGSSLIIDAPTRIHAEVTEVIEMMKKEVDRYEADRAEAAQRAAQAEAAHAEELRVRREAQIASLEAKVQEKLEHIIALEARKQQLEDEHTWAERSAMGMVIGSKETEQEAKDRAKRDKERLPGLYAELVRIEIEIKDALEYRSAAQSQLMQLRTEAIANAPASISRVPNHEDRSTRADQN